MGENNILTKEELVKKAKELSESDDLAKAILEANNLRKRWRNAREDEESFYDKELSDAFYSYLSKINAKEDEIFKVIEDHKKSLIEKAKEIANKGNFSKGSSQMEKLFAEWKDLGHINKEKDDELWNEFYEILSKFRKDKKEYFNNLFKSFEDNKAKKEELIEKAKEANQLENFKEVGKRMEELMEEWKKSGSAGKDHDDELWKAFNTERKTFFANRKKYYEELKDVFAKRVEDKKALISEVKKYLAISDFTDEEINTVKELRTKWKEIGFAGKDNDDDLYNEFNTLLNKYFENLRLYK